jgi:hypothetical protein
MALVVLTVQVCASVPKALEDAYTDLDYSLTVEWDQKDQDFLNKEVKKFSDEVEALRKLGYSNEELMEAMISRVKNERAAAELRLAVRKDMSPEQFQEHVRSIMKHSGDQGASWREAVFGISFILGLTVVWWGGMYLINTQMCDWCLAM